jgi:hypothetical protein
MNDWVAAASHGHGRRTVTPPVTTSKLDQQVGVTARDFFFARDHDMDFVPGLFVAQAGMWRSRWMSHVVMLECVFFFLTKGVIRFMQVLCIYRSSCKAFSFILSRK